MTTARLRSDHCQAGDGKVDAALTGELIERAQGGEQQAFGELYELYLERIYRYVYFKVSREEDAEDLTEVIFLKAWENLHTFTPTGPDAQGFTAWLYRVAHNTVVDHYRKSRAEVTLDPRTHTPREWIVDPEERACHGVEVEELREAMGMLTEQERQILLLRFVEGLPHAQTAGIMGHSEVGSRVLQHRALSKLRQALARREEEWLARSGQRGEVEAV